MHIVLMGAQGTGKGTQATILAQAYRIPHISTGDILRQAVKDGTPLGKKAQAVMERGELVSDDIMIGIVRERLARPDCEKGFIFDGFPRTIAQADAFTEAVRDRGLRLDAVVSLEVPREILLERMTGRRVCRGCGAIYHVKYSPPEVAGRCDRCGGELYQRVDDHPDAINTRLEAYERQTAPLIDYYRQRGLLKAVDGSGLVEEVAGAIKSAVAGQ